MKIGELADRAGVSTKTIRYYESIGLLRPPGRTSSNYRDYGDDAAERLRFIRDSQVAGLTLAEVGSILDMKDAGQSTCAHTRELIHRHLDEIDRQIEALKLARVEMAALAERADHMDPGECSNPHRCQVIAAAQEGAHAPGNRTRLPLHTHH
jgi:MerR family copper efflux transcriptional regulator